MAQQVHRSGSAVTTRQEECMRVGWYERKGAARDMLVVGEMPAPTHRAALSEPCEAADPAIAAGLTAREGEVLRLLTEGVSDREIAAALSISKRTAGNHVQHILQKLEVDSRTAATVFAVRHGLA